MLCILTAKTRPYSARQYPTSLLLYIPMHVSEPTSHLHQLGHCLFSHAPLLLHDQHVRVDVLLVLNGASSDGRRDVLRSILEEMVRPSLPHAHISVEFVETKKDRYDRHADKGASMLAGNKTQPRASDVQWVSGPNSAFYDALHNGTVFEQHVRQYDLVQQLETDVCALRAGWLDALVEPMLSDARILVSGSTTRCDCVYVEETDTCEPLTRFEGDHMQRHVNGNAMYRVGADLAAVMARARTKYGNGQPFDLALYWTAQEMGVQVIGDRGERGPEGRQEGMAHRGQSRSLLSQSRLHSNPLYFNLPCKIDRLRFTVASYYGVSDVVAVHASRDLRVPALEAVTSRGKRGAPLTLVPLDKPPNQVLDAFLRSLDGHMIQQVVFVAPTKALYTAISATLPLRVVPAFQDDAHNAPVLAQSETWPASASWAGSIATAVARVADMGYAPFVVPPESHAVRNYVPDLVKLTSDTFYIGWRTDVAGRVRMPLTAVDRHSQQQGIDIGLAYAPVNASTAATLHAWAELMRQGHQPTLDHLERHACTNGATIAHLDGDKFVQGGPSLTSGWPVNVAAMRVGGHASLPTNIVLITADTSATSPSMDAHARHQLSVFQMRQARVWPATDKPSCRTYSTVSQRPLPLDQLTLNSALRRYANFAAFAAANAIDCLILPGFYLNETRSWVHAFELIDFNQFVRVTGAASFVPSLHWIKDVTSSAYVPFVRPHSRPRPLVAGRPSDVGPRAMGAAVAAPPIALAPRLSAAVAFSKSILGASFACIDGSEHSMDQVALYALGRTSRSLDSSIDALRRRYHHLASNQPLLLTGAWRAAGSSLLASPSIRLATMADIRNAHATRPQRQWHAFPELHLTPHPLHDIGWAATIETAICWSAEAVVPGADVLPPVLPMAAVVRRMAGHIPPSLLERDLASIKVWTEQRSKVPLTMRTPTFQVVARTACESRNGLALLLSVADMVDDGIVFAPSAWADCLAGAPGAHRDDADTASIYRHNVLPPSAQILAQPRLAALSIDGSVLAVDRVHHGRPSQHGNDARTSLAALTRLAQLWSRRTIWTHYRRVCVDELRRISLNMADSGDGVILVHA